MPTKLVPAKLIVAAGIGLFILGFALFLHVLGSGGGWLAMCLMLIGGVSTVAGILLAIVRSLSRGQ